RRVRPRTSLRTPHSSRAMPNLALAAQKIRTIHALARRPANSFISTGILVGRHCMMRGSTLAVVAAALSVASAHALAQEFNVTIRNNAFVPQKIRVPAGKRVPIYVSNEDASAEEFESPALKDEKVIPGKSKGLVRVGPLAPGRYEFFGDFHP